MLIAEEQPYRVLIEDEQLMAEMASMQLFTLDRQPYDVAIMTQAIDYESLNSCPALLQDRRCGIHHDRKPAVCSMVPFDSLYPDSLQNRVLLGRAYAENCIVPGKQDGYDVVVENRLVKSVSFRDALRVRRDALRMEKEIWGRTVFAELQSGLLNQQRELEKLPLENGLLSLPIIPVLMILAGISEKCRERCLDYADRQIRLIDNRINAAIARKIPADKQTTKILRIFRQHYMNFCFQVGRNPLLQAVPLQSVESTQRISEIEAYLL